MIQNKSLAVATTRREAERRKSKMQTLYTPEMGEKQAPAKHLPTTFDHAARGSTANAEEDTVFHDAPIADASECQKPASEDVAVNFLEKLRPGHLMPDHVHMLISIPPKYSVAEVIGFMKGKSSIWIAQNVERKARNFTGHKFWARGYFVSTVGRDEEMIRAYIKNQEMQDRELDQLSMIP